MPAEAITLHCPCKINLALSVGSPRPDGMHPIASWMAAHPDEVVTFIMQSNLPEEVFHQSLVDAGLADASGAATPGDPLYFHDAPPGSPWPPIGWMLAQNQRLVVFTDDPAVVEAAARYLRILGLVMPLLVVEVVLNNVAAGVGDRVLVARVDSSEVRAWILDDALGTYLATLGSSDLSPIFGPPSALRAATTSAGLPALHMRFGGASSVALLSCGSSP